MTKVIAQKDIMQYSGMKTVEFPLGTLLTPSAKDWANEHGIVVAIGQNSICSKTTIEKAAIDEKSELLNQIIRSVLNNVDKSGGLLTRNELVKIVIASLERMGCIVESK